MKKWIEEFKAFAFKGNMINLAVGMMIGGAFTSIVNSLVNDIFMPVVSLLTGRIDFTNKFIALDGKVYATLQAAKDAGAATVNYGAFLTQLINFFLMALVVFFVVKQLNRLETLGKKKEEEAVAVTQKECPACRMKIHVSATRCPYCTTILNGKEKE